MAIDSKSIKIFALSGSTRNESFTRRLVLEINRRLAESGCDVQHWCLRERPLPIADPDYHHDPAQHPDLLVREFVGTASASDAFILGSPIYHNSYSGVLKNAIDHLVIPHFTQKPVGLVSHGGNRSPQAVDHLRIVVRGLNGIAIPSQVCTAAADYPTSTQPWDADIAGRLTRFCNECIVFAKCFRALRGG